MVGNAFAKAEPTTTYRNILNALSYHPLIFASKLIYQCPKKF
ncbi:hypothetical protein NMS_0463 [Nonlabens marinus S1-08]|uniref:Uncharacterized protein n=1 Tax=Nonlabens marinus S1-08 TaxID=1454201 RepID=W8VW62_9FLAO|nr:hypothetical protein NMS_0463 [Nonlabens marinus S1-08]